MCREPPWEPPWELCCSPQKKVVHIIVAIASCSVTFWLQTSGMAEANTQRDSDDDWLEELFKQPGSSLPCNQKTATAPVCRVEAVASAPGRASHVAAGTSFRALPADATSKRTLRAPPSIEAIKRRRLEQEELDSERERLWQKERWDRCLGRRQVGSPDARRSGRKISGPSLGRCSSRSRSPGVCERLAWSETSLVSGVT